MAEKNFGHLRGVAGTRPFLDRKIKNYIESGYLFKILFAFDPDNILKMADISLVISEGRGRATPIFIHKIKNLIKITIFSKIPFASSNIWPER